MRSRGLDNEGEVFVEGLLGLFLFSPIWLLPVNLLLALAVAGEGLPRWITLALCAPTLLLYGFGAPSMMHVLDGLTYSATTGYALWYSGLAVTLTAALGLVFKKYFGMAVAIAAINALVYIGAPWAAEIVAAV